MASEIIVNTIKAPTSGANANKVIIPSGVTLDASAGTISPSAGQVVNKEYHYIGGSTDQDISSSTYTQVLSKAYTPKLSSSIIIFNFVVQLRGYYNGSAGCRWAYRLKFNSSQDHQVLYMGTYDYGGHGTWHKQSVPICGKFTNTTGASVTAAIDVRSQEVQGIGLYGNQNGEGYNTVEIMEVAQ